MVDCSNHLLRKARTWSGTACRDQARTRGLRNQGVSLEVGCKRTCRCTQLCTGWARARLRPSPLLLPRSVAGQPPVAALWCQPSAFLPWHFPRCISDTPFAWPRLTQGRSAPPLCGPSPRAAPAGSQRSGGPRQDKRSSKRVVNPFAWRQPANATAAGGFCWRQPGQSTISIASRSGGRVHGN